MILRKIEIYFCLCTLGRYPVLYSNFGFKLIERKFCFLSLTFVERFSGLVGDLFCLFVFSLLFPINLYLMSSHSLYMAVSHWLLSLSVAL